MKTIHVKQFGGPEVLELANVPSPDIKAGEVLVRAKAIGVNPVDTYVRAGRYGDRSFPFTPGMDAAGEVEAVGPDVKRFCPGDRVYLYGSLSGAYAELILCDEHQVHPLPKSVSFQQGAALGVPYATAYMALFVRGEARAGQTVLIHGASGGVGIASVQLARAVGLSVIGTAGSERGLELILAQGAHHAVNHSLPDELAKIQALTLGKGVDLIVEMAAHINLAKDLKLLAKHGKVVVVGSRGSIEVDPRDTMVKHSDIRGMSLLSVDTDILAAAHAAIYAGLENGSLRPVVGKEFPLADVRRAHEEVLKAGAYGKIVLIP